MKKEHFIRWGFISKVHSYKGELVFISDKVIIDDITEKESVFVEINKQLIPFFIEKAYSSGESSFIVKLLDIDTEQKSKTLVKCGIYLPSLDAEEENDIFAFKNYKVIDNNYGEIGTVKNILEMPQHFVFEISNNNSEILIPANDVIIKKKDIKNKILYIDAPPGLIDIYINKS